MPVHIALIIIANQAAFSVRFDGEIPPDQLPVATNLLPLLVLIRLLVFLPLRLHQSVWRYVSVWDLRNIVVGVGVSSVVFWVVTHGVLGLLVYPRTVLFIDAVFLICLMAGVRLARRMSAAPNRPTGRRPVVIYGAGNAGEMIVRDMLHNGSYGMYPVAFVDDASHKVGQTIHGVPVLGGNDRLLEIVSSTKAEEIIIAIPSASPTVLRQLLRRLEPCKLRISTLPRLSEQGGDEVGVNKVRQLKLEDLLAREPITLNYGPVRQVLEKQRVMVTGAGGSIGSELSRQVALANPGDLLLLDQYENGLYAIQNEISEKYPSVKTKCVIGDITDARRIDQVIGMFRPQVIFHAAAHKHVPLMEGNPCEAVKNNVRGTRIVAEAAQRWGVDRFVMISTDKAVNPTSVMGAAKRVAELVVKSLDTSGNTRFMVVRFGNVLGSNGSVIPRFQTQIAAGGPVTVTHPEMRRYFMLIPEAVQLVLHAASINDRGSIFVLEMGEQVRLVDMAHDLIKLSGYVPDLEIAIAYTGVRPGEKLYEELVGPGEFAEPSSVPKIKKVTSSPGDVNLNESVATLEQAACDGLDDLVIDQLCRVVPGFKPNGRASSLQLT